MLKNSIAQENPVTAQQKQPNQQSIFPLNLFKISILKTTLRLLSVLLILGFLYQPAALAADFPNKGNKADWVQASRVYDQALNDFQAKKYEPAIQKLQTAIVMYPHDYHYYILLGMTYKTTGNMDLAEATLSAATQMDLNNWEVWNALAHVYYEKKEFEKSLDAANRALALNPPKQQREMIEKAIQFTNDRLKAAKAQAQ